MASTPPLTDTATQRSGIAPKYSDLAGGGGEEVGDLLGDVGRTHPARLPTLSSRLNLVAWIQTPPPHRRTGSDLPYTAGDAFLDALVTEA